jgi:hypothetical protein
MNRSRLLLRRTSNQLRRAFSFDYNDSDRELLDAAKPIIAATVAGATLATASYLVYLTDDPHQVRRYEGSLMFLAMPMAGAVSGLLAGLAWKVSPPIGCFVGALVLLHWTDQAPSIVHMIHAARHGPAKRGNATDAESPLFRGKEIRNKA